MAEGNAPAIDVRSVHLSYKKKTPVLDGIDLYVEKGHIYGLLGPSGCGKTTLLKCVTGLLKPDKGVIHVLGHTPGSYESKIPGPTIGYMPQEIALFQEFTILETFYYFGRIHQMPSKAIKERAEFLISFLNLPSSSQVVGELSGGQMRRLSLAVAMLHSPPILILDEPTVGVDPLLRERIWSHLVDISRSDGTTIIITTHYIEEARTANYVGLMRGGKLLAQGRPDVLIEKYRKNSLETVFLHLCVKDNQSAQIDKERDSEANGMKTQSFTSEASDDEKLPLLGSIVKVQTHSNEGHGTLDSYDKSCMSNVKLLCSKLPKGRRVGALVIKNVNIQKRRLGFLFFQFILPAIQITIYSLSIGGTPKGLPVAVVNFDKGVEIEGIGSTNYTLSFSQAFLSEIDHDIIQIKLESNLDAAKDFIKNGSSWAAISIGPDFSKDSLARVLSHDLNDTVINGSTIYAWTDSTNELITVTIKTQIELAYENLYAGLKIQAKRKYNLTLPDVKSLQAIPIKYGRPVYGSDSETFLDFVAPGIICTILLFQAVGLTSLSLTIERKQGLYERSLVSGVTVLEIILAHIVTEFVIMSVQCAVLLVFAFFVFNIYNVGPVVVIILFALLLGTTGMCLGFVISSIASNEREASQLSLGLVFPFLLISGILWPIQAMPVWLQTISRVLPLTLAVDGLRFVLGRGWDLTYHAVWEGFAVTAGWTIGMLIISLIITHFKK